MALSDLHWFSSVLGKQVTTRVLLPDVGTGPFPTFYLLHGLSDDHTIWSRRTRLEMYAARLPLIIVMPNGDRGFYTDHAEGPAYGKHIGEELPSTIERFFPAKASRTARCIGGLSMGGYGAMRIALAYPDRFISANSHSGALQFGNGKRKSYLFGSEFEHILGKRPVGTPHDLNFLARQCKKGGRLPKLKIDCGTEDFLIEDNRLFHKLLADLKIPHAYDEHPGAHSWDYWDVRVREALAFHAAALKISPIA